MINKKESGFCRKWTFVSIGEGAFFGGDSGGGIFLIIGGRCVPFLFGGGGVHGDAPIIGKLWVVGFRQKII